MRNMSRARNKSKMNSATNHFSNFVDIFDKRYYTINKRILCYIGQWSYQTIFERSIRSTLLVLLGFSLLVPQTLQLIQSWGHAASFIECLSPFITNFACYIKLFSFAVHSQKIRWLLEEVRHDWECTRHLQEFKILHEHGRRGMYFTIAYLTVFYTTIAAWTSVPLIPIVMDMVIPLNGSRPHIKYYPTDYRVDPDKYFYPIFFHSFTVTSIGLLIFVAIDTFFMMISQHACAIFNILRYRLEHITQVDNEVSVQLDTNIREDFYYQQIVNCIINHKRAIDLALENLPQVSLLTTLHYCLRVCASFIRTYFSINISTYVPYTCGRYVGVMQASCQWYLVLIVGLNMLSISCTCSQIVAKDTSTTDMLRFTFFTVAQVFHLFCNSMPGQWIMETSSVLQNSAYSCDWHLMPPQSRRLIVLFIRRSIEPCIITAGKMYVMSMENFCRVLKTSMSYMTLLSSTQ